MNKSTSAKTAGTIGRIALAAALLGAIFTLPGIETRWDTWATAGEPARTVAPVAKSEVVPVEIPAPVPVVAPDEAFQVINGTDLYGSISVGDKYAPYEPIVAGCDCIVPPGSTVDINWQLPAAVKALPGDKETQLHIWAPPGEHVLRARVVVHTYETISVLIPDPADPTNFQKAKLGTVKVLKSFNIDDVERKFLVEGVAPVPPGPNPPGPTPPGPNPPTPDDLTGFPGEVRKWLKALPDGAYSKEKALNIADVYAQVGSRGSDDSNSSGWTLSTFQDQVKIGIRENVSIDDQVAWKDAFFVPLGKKQGELYAERKLKSTDKKQIAALYTETAEAIRAAAY